MKCHCGQVILADTEDWMVSLCPDCYDLIGFDIGVLFYFPGTKYEDYGARQRLAFIEGYKCAMERVRDESSSE